MSLIYKIKQKSSNKYIFNYFDGIYSEVELREENEAEIFLNFPELELHELFLYHGFEIGDLIVESYEIKLVESIIIEKDIYEQFSLQDKTKINQ